MATEEVVDGYITYSELSAVLRNIEKGSDRVKLDIVGKSAGGRDIYLLAISDCSTLERLDDYRALASFIADNPDEALAMLDEGRLEYKIPTYIQGNIHGSERGGTDACLSLIRDLAYGRREGVAEILENLIVLVVPTMNPDGRVTDKWSNDNMFDLNRDFITASQPEARAIISILRDWNPLVMYDLHGYYEEYTMDPVTEPYNPALSVDLYLKWLLPMAGRMKEELERAGFPVTVPCLDWNNGWDGYLPIYASVYPYYHGAFGWVGEACPVTRIPESDIRGHYTAINAGMRFVVKSRLPMLRDQIEAFRRWESRMNGEFPYAYIIPMTERLQADSLQAAKLVDHLIFHGVKVYQANKDFTAGGIDFPYGTYVVPLSQGKSGLAYNMLFEGKDLSYEPGLPLYDVAGWNLPELWGCTRYKLEEAFEANLISVVRASYPSGEIPYQADFAYGIRCTTNNAIRLVNKLLDSGIVVQRTVGPFDYKGVFFEAGTFLVPAKQQGLISVLNRMAEELHIQAHCINEPLLVESVTLRQPKVAVLYWRARHDYWTDEPVGDTQYVLQNLGFKVDLVDVYNIPDEPLGYYDVVFVPDGDARKIWTLLGSAGRRHLLKVIENGSTYIGVGKGGAAMVNEARLIDAAATVIAMDTVKTGDTRYKDGCINGICRLDYNQQNPMTLGYAGDIYAFVNWPVVFSVGTGVEVIARLAQRNMFVAGFWPGWERSQGAPIIVQGKYGKGDVILFGILPLFKAGTELTYRLVANALFRLPQEHSSADS